MKTRILIGAAVAVLGFTGLAASEIKTNPADADAPHQVLAAYDAAVSAAELANPEALVRMVADHPDVTLAINGTVLHGPENVAARIRANFAGIASTKYALRPRQVTLLSDTAAVVVTEGTVAVTTTAGETFTRAFAHTVVYIRQAGGWRVLQSHQSLTPIEGRT